MREARVAAGPVGSRRFRPATIRVVASDWASRRGRTVRAELGTCGSDDPRCIGFKADHGTLPDDPPGCASLQTATYNPNTGEWGGSTAVRLIPGWATTGYDSKNIQGTIAHEVGHYFGLWNRLDSTCSASDTVMGPRDCYGAQPPAASDAIGPTASDADALKRSTYDNGNRRICGW